MTQPTPETPGPGSRSTSNPGPGFAFNPRTGVGAGAGAGAGAPPILHDPHVKQVEAQAVSATRGAHAVQVEQLLREVREPRPGIRPAIGPEAPPASIPEASPEATGDGFGAAARLLVKMAALGVAAAVPLGAIVAGVVQGLDAAYAGTFNAAINDKIDRLETLPGPRIVLVSGSSGAFGLDQARLERATGMPVVNVALQSGFGMRFQTDLVRGNLHAGDVVVIAYEYAMMSRLGTFGAELTMTAFDQRLDRYRYVPREGWGDMASYFPTFLAKKVDAQTAPVENRGVYTRSAFDAAGQMVYPRPRPTVESPLPEKFAVHIDGATLHDDMAAYLNELGSYASSQGARVVVSYPPVMDEAVRSSPADIASFEESLSTKLDLPVISDPRDYILPRADFFDTQYHCNDHGQEVRTDLLARDLRAFLDRS